MLARNPDRPSLAKWTPLGVCLDFFVLAFTGDFLTELFEYAMAKVANDDTTDERLTVWLPQELLHTDGGGGGGGGDAEAFVQDFSWKTIASKGKRKGSAALRDIGWRVAMVILAVAIEPERRLHLYYMSISEGDCKCRTNEWPPLLDPWLVEGSF